MQKNYILLTGTIFGIGGGQLYTRNKAVFLRETGWNVLVFSALNGTVRISGLEDDASNVIPQLSRNPSLFPAAERKKVLEMLGNSLKSPESHTVIESHTIEASLWGEMLAEKIKGKHFVYLLGENFARQPEYVMNFLDFKHKRREMAGIVEKSLEVIFDGYKELSGKERYHLQAVCSNSVEDVENPVINGLCPKDINIGSIGRLDKRYVPPMVDEISKFAAANPDVEIQLILVGGSPDGTAEKEILAKTQSTGNLSTVITGYMFPIPRKLFGITDFFISAAGSAIVSAGEGVPTLSLDVRNSMPIGLLGIETTDILYGGGAKEESISELLQEFLIRQKMRKSANPGKGYVKVSDFREEFRKHIDFIENSNASKEYYTIFFPGSGVKDKIRRSMISVLGIKNYLRLVNSKLMMKARRIYG